MQGQCWSNPWLTQICMRRSRSWCCSMLQYAAVCFSMLQYVAVCCSILQCVAVCCRMLQYVAEAAVDVSTKTCSWSSKSIGSFVEYRLFYRALLQKRPIILTCQLAMGWLRLVGLLKSQVSFAEYRLFYRALLKKRPIILRSLLLEATPYGYITWEVMSYMEWLRLVGSLKSIGLFCRISSLL